MYNIILIFSSTIKLGYNAESIRTSNVYQKLNILVKAKSLKFSFKKLSKILLQISISEIIVIILTLSYNILLTPSTLFIPSLLQIYKFNGITK